MATYTALRDLFSDDVLLNKIEVATIIAAEAVRSEVPGTAIRRAWAKLAFEQPREESRKMLMAVLAANSNLTVAQITGASDAAIQTNVDAAVDIFAGE